MDSVFCDKKGDSLLMKAHAKTNIYLRVLGERKDGFHDIETLMTRLSLADDLEIILVDKGKNSSLEISYASELGDLSLPKDSKNLIIKAAELFLQKYRKKREIDIAFNFRLKKKIPIGAGLGGGSSNAASALLGMNRLVGDFFSRKELLKIAKLLGSDVCFFLHENVCLCRGRGEIIEEQIDNDWELPITLIKPPFAVSSTEAYGLLKKGRELHGVLYAPQLTYWGEMVNDLERAVFHKYPYLGLIKTWALEQPEAQSSLLSGSGSSVLVCQSRAYGGEELAARAQQRFCDCGNLWTHVGKTIPAVSLV